MVYYALDDRHIVTLFRQGLTHVEEQGGRGARPSRATAPEPRAGRGRR
jgi:hypothetical protein